MQTAIIALAVFCAVVVVHEFGHFIVAKLSGITVHEFSIGMGPSVFNKEYKGTKYSLRAIPLGGYVKMEGEDEDSDSEGSFSNKSLPKRMAVILAGAFMNFVLAFLVFIIYFGIIGTPTNTIEKVIADTPAFRAGIKADDTIREINGNKINGWEDIVKSISTTSSDKLQIKIERNNEIKTIETETEVKDGNRVIGIMPEMKASVLGSITNSAKLLVDMVKMMFDFIIRAVSGGVSSNEVSGPVGVYYVIGEAAKAGFMQLILITGFLSVNLGFFNLLPIPALDGSRFIFLVAEGIRGKKIDPEKEGLIHLIGFAMLIALTVFITYKDILKLKSL